ncbi:IS1634 family transposase, partial [Brachybacterium epidermidis]
MAPFLRKVTTASGATAVQVVAKEGRRNRVLEHLGSAHSEADLAALMHLGRERLHAGQEQLDLDLTSEAAPSAGVLTMQDRRSRYLLDVLEVGWQQLGFDVIDDEAFFQLVAARLIEPTSMSDSRRVLAEVGVEPVHRNTF